MGRSEQLVLPSPATVSASPADFDPICCGTGSRSTNKSTGSKMAFGMEVPSVHNPVMERVRERMYLKGFLRKHRFKDAQTARSGGGCFFPRESLYPIHLAAQLGDLNLVVLLLASGADPDVETSKGRTAVMLAEEADLYGSHEQALYHGRNGCATAEQLEMWSIRWT
ncbi:Ankyrin-2 (ANK-2) (Ankyrin-B) (Brain ankyrin) [Durusdinium trenchii]|uniref:Ankyrin-2 (ANK-2) (Ankyrin-B) (Brain ankyrin) n=1 Tax=Durusdinium trenchii TaxID=1381693 RepID=A0ABP0R7D3_9DINO